MRTIIDLNDSWFFKKEEAVLTSLPYDWESVTLPHTWNERDGQDGGNDYWRGTATYVRGIRKPETDGKIFLEFRGVAHTAEVFLNGDKLAHHEGGYSTFRVELKDLKDENVICVTADNSSNNRVYPQKADFTFYGGIYRDVNLIIVPDKHFELVKDGTPGIKVTPKVCGKDAVVKLESWQNGEGEVVYTIGDLTASAVSENGYACTEILLKDVHLWDGLDDPYLYEVKAVYGEDEISSKFGCRTMEFDPQKGFILNGRQYPLRGVSRHQDRWEMGNAITLKEHKEDMDLIKEIGANSIRLAHYQHAQEFYDLCDEFGMVVWAEIPYITLHMPSGRENTLSQMRELVTQNYNHPCICCWGLSNEITAASAVSGDLLENHRELNDLCHRMDETRPTTMAHVFMLETDSELIDVADIGSYNLYFGWYVGTLEQNEEFFDEYHAKYPDRMIGLSEYGADANPQFHSSHPERGDYSEEYQCLYHEHIIKVIEDRPYLWCSYVWNMFDFAADGRDEGGKNGQNQKGTVTFDRKVKKDVFYLYKAYWSREPFVHLCGSRYTDRCEDTTEVKVYSNLDEVTLKVDGEVFETRHGSRVFTFSVPLTGEHHIEAVSGDFHDEITVKKAAEPNPAYFLSGQPVTNWFDQDNFDPNCYSLNDTLGELMQDQRTAAIVDRIMSGARASRGDVAEATADNPNLQKMLARMPMGTLLKQAGDAVKPEAVKALNAALQQIRKNN